MELLILPLVKRPIVEDIECLTKPTIYLLESGSSEGRKSGAYRKGAEVIISLFKGFKNGISYKSKTVI